MPFWTFWVHIFIITFRYSKNYWFFFNFFIFYNLLDIFIFLFLVFWLRFLLRFRVFFWFCDKWLFSFRQRIIYSQYIKTIDQKWVRFIFQYVSIFFIKTVRQLRTIIPFCPHFLRFIYFYIEILYTSLNRLNYFLLVAVYWVHGLLLAPLHESDIT